MGKSHQGDVTMYDYMLTVASGAQREVTLGVAADGKIASFVFGEH
jgi:hypothetical protein